MASHARVKFNLNKKLFIIRGLYILTWLRGIKLFYGFYFEQLCVSSRKLNKTENTEDTIAEEFMKNVNEITSR